VQAPYRYTLTYAGWGVFITEGSRAYVARRRSDPSLTPARIAKMGASPLRAPSVKKAPSLFVKPSPTSTLPRVVSAKILAEVPAVAGVATDSSRRMPCLRQGIAEPIEFFALEENLAAILGQQGAEEACLSARLRRWPRTTSGCSRH
jgi:hypothetical protein